MTGTREPEQDTALPLFAPPERRGEPGRIEPELAIAAPASERPFRLEGERATLQGSQRGSVTSVRIDAVRVVGRLEAGAGAVANTVLSPGRMKRERIGASGSVQETILVAPTLPWIALHWSGRADLMVHLLPDARQVRYHTRGGLATVADPSTDRVLALSLGPGEASWTTEAAPGGGLLLRADGCGDPRTLVIAYGMPADVRTAFAALSHLGAHEARAVTGVRDVLELRTGARELDDGVAWLASRLRHGVLRADRETGGEGQHSPSEEWMWAGLGCVVVGDTDGALRCIRRLRLADAHTAAGLVAGRLALTTGRVEAAQESVAALLSVPDDDDRDEALGSLARRTVADALRYGATADTLARLREGVAAPRPETATPRPGTPADPTGPAGSPPLPGSSGRTSLPAPTSGRRLPTIGGTPDLSGIGAWLTGMLEPTPQVALPRTGTGPRSEEVAGALQAWAELAGNPTAGWAVWRALVHEGLSGPHGGAAWDDVSRPPAVTGILLAAMSHGWMGAFPDAPVGRLVLTPRIPAGLTAFGVTGIPLGDARITMRYERRDATHGFTFEMDFGRVPPYLVFETTVPHRVGRVLLDGTPIDPDIEHHAGGTTVRLQTALDALRLVEIEPV